MDIAFMTNVKVRISVAKKGFAMNVGKKANHIPVCRNHLNDSALFTLGG